MVKEDMGWEMRKLRRKGGGTELKEYVDKERRRQGSKGQS